MTAALPDPYPEFAALRSDSPVVRQGPLLDGGPATFVVYRHAEVTKVLRDGATFSSVLMAEGMAEVWGRRIIVGMDAPEHHRHRALVSTAFRQSTLRRWEDALVRRVVHELIDQFVSDREADLVPAFTLPFPAKVIAGVLGLREDDYAEFQRWALGIIDVTGDYDRAVRFAGELREYLTTIVDLRRVDPAEDLVTDLVAAELDGEKLDDEEIYSFLRMLLPAGIETTYRSTGNLLYLLLAHPEQLRAVTDDRSLIPQAIEEALRFETPVLAAWRVSTTDISLAGVDIPAGSVVMVALGSANRDPEVHADPEVFDIFRDQKQHVSFGAGPHLCLGMHLARMETRIALDALLDRLPNLRLAPGSAVASQIGISGDLMFRSPTSLPVAWD